MQLRLAPAADILRSDLPKAGMQSRGPEAGVVGLYDALRVALADGCRVGVHGVQQELHGGCVASLQVSVVVVRNDNSGIDLAAADGVTKLVDRKVIADQPEALALAQRGDQFAALPRPAVIHGSELDVGHGGAQGKTQQQQLQRGRENQRERQAAVAPDLGELLADERAHPVIEDWSHGLTS